MVLRCGARGCRRYLLLAARCVRRWCAVSSCSSSIGVARSGCWCAPPALGSSWSWAPAVSVLRSSLLVVVLRSCSALLLSLRSSCRRSCRLWAASLVAGSLRSRFPLLRCSSLPGGRIVLRAGIGIRRTGAGGCRLGLCSGSWSCDLGRLLEWLAFAVCQVALEANRIKLCISAERAG